MAMLAEPRRRKKFINIRGKNAWSEDSNKYGQKMLEKMGWQKGNGLGAKQDGMTDHIKVKLKDDGAGLGFKDKNDQWTQHEESFNGLLMSLNGGVVETDKLHSESSLEEKSKKSRARLHYKKFTKGKDISQYSAKDLANIFGKKSLHKMKEPEEQEQEADIKEDDAKEKKILHGYSFVEGGNIHDYFKSKMSGYVQEVNNKNDEDEDDFKFVGFAGAGNDSNENGKESESNDAVRKIGFMSFAKSTENDEESKEADNKNGYINFVKPKKSKKVEDSEQNLEISDECENKKDKKKKRKLKESDVDEQTVKKKKKEKLDVLEDQEENSTVLTEVELTKKEKKKLKKSKQKLDEYVESEIAVVETEVVEKDKKKKQKR